METITLPEISRLTSGNFQIHLTDRFSANIFGVAVISESIFETAGEDVLLHADPTYKLVRDENAKFVQLRFESPEKENLRIALRLVFSRDRLFKIQLNCIGTDNDIPIKISSPVVEPEVGHFRQELKGKDYFALSMTDPRLGQSSWLFVDFQGSKHKEDGKTQEAAASSSLWDKLMEKLQKPI